MNNEMAIPSLSNIPCPSDGLCPLKEDKASQVNWKRIAIISLVALASLVISGAVFAALYFGAQAALGLSIGIAVIILAAGILSATFYLWRCGKTAEKVDELVHQNEHDDNVQYDINNFNDHSPLSTRENPLPQSGGNVNSLITPPPTPAANLETPLSTFVPLSDSTPQPTAAPVGLGPQLPSKKASVTPTSTFVEPPPAIPPREKSAGRNVSHLFTPTQQPLFSIFEAQLPSHLPTLSLPPREISPIVERPIPYRASIAQNLVWTPPAVPHREKRTIVVSSRVLSLQVLAARALCEFDIKSSSSSNAQNDEVTKIEEEIKKLWRAIAGKEKEREAFLKKPSSETNPEMSSILLAQALEMHNKVGAKEEQLKKIKRDKDEISSKITALQRDVSNGKSLDLKNFDDLAAQNKKIESEITELEKQIKTLRSEKQYLEKESVSNKPLVILAMDQTVEITKLERQLIKLQETLRKIHPTSPLATPFTDLEVNKLSFLKVAQN